MINKIKTKNQDKQFIKVDDFVSSPVASIKSLKSFLSLDDKFIYTDHRMDASEASEFITKMCMTLAIDSLVSNELCDLTKDEVSDLICEVCSSPENCDDFINMCSIGWAEILTIRTLNSNVEYSDSMLDISSPEIDKIIDWLINKSVSYRKNLLTTTKED